MKTATSISAPADCPESLQQPTPASVDLPKLTNAQMLEDFDYMTRILRDVFPAATVNKKVYGIDVFDKLKSYRSRITGNETPEDFAVVLSQALMSCKGSHLFMSDLLFYYRNDKRIRQMFKGITDEAIDLSHAYNIAIQAKLSSFLRRLSIPLLYHQGNYYTMLDFTCKGVNYKHGMLLLSVDGKTPSDAIASTQDWLDSFDCAKGVFYGNCIGFSVIADNFYVFMDYNGKASTFKFQDENGKTVEIIYPAGTGIASVNRPQSTFPQLKQTVEYLNDKQILYVRIPLMDEKDIAFYQDEIKKKTMLKQPGAIVIDVRSNPGGSDLVWRTILESIIDRELCLTYKSAIKNSSLAKNNELQQFEAVENIFGNGEKRPDITKSPETVPFLDNEEFIIMEDESILKPAADSLKLQVPIYIIAHDIYSSAGCLLSVAHFKDDIISVGTRNPAILGRGITPLFISLPNSKIIFSVETHLDLTNCQSAEDTLHTKMEVEVEMTAKERLDYINLDISKMPLEEALTQYDPYFKKVLELMNAKNKSGK